MDRRSTFGSMVVLSLLLGPPALAQDDPPPADTVDAAGAETSAIDAVSPPVDAPPVEPPKPTRENPLDFSRGEPATDIYDALFSGTLKIDIRLRAELADQSGLRPSDSYTMRTRIGYLTQELGGLQAYIEGENVFTFDNSKYNAAGLNGQPDRTPVADVEVTELNQLWLSYALPLGETWRLSAKPGRQLFTLDDMRFIGHVRWRQDDQTYDAVTVRSNLGIGQLEATYGYLWKINRIFGNERDWDSDSHVINVAHPLGSIGKLVGFAYLLDFRGDSPMDSSQTYGLRLTGDQIVDDGYTFVYEASFAYQEDFGDNPVSYSAPYYKVDLGLKIDDVGTIGAGYEVLGSDDGAFAFRTPLATGHKFNGFSDVFLTTPPDGLEDAYIYFKTSSLPLDIDGLVRYHYFGGNDSIDKYGTEIDANLTKQIHHNVGLGVKYSYFFGEEPGFPDRAKITFDVTVTF